MAPQDNMTVRQRLVHLGLNCAVFALCYLQANALAQQHGITRHAALALDAGMPFWPWMVLPYLSSGLFFVGAFFAVRSRDGLRVLSQRLLLATALAALVFVLYPLQFSAQRPPVDAALPAALFQALALVDQPYNQLPSLHVAYCLLLWASLRRVPASLWARALLAAWLLLTALATLFTYQHHLLDVVAGIGLGLLCLYGVKPGRAEANVGLYYLVAGSVVAVLGAAAWPAALTLYLVTSLWLVGLAYARGDRFFLHKRQGRYPWWVWCVYAPYLLGYRLAWLAVRWRGRRQPAVRRISDQLWIGRRLSPAEARLLPPGCCVFDLANELPESAALRSHPYQHFPLLDIVAPPAEAVRHIVAAMRRETDAGRSIFLHCAMGQRRCVRIADTYTSTTYATLNP